jgi:MarR family transcriptional regulator, organic hydroperoxide resistance regulator
MRTIDGAQPTPERQVAAEEAMANLGRAVGSLRCAGSQRLVRLGVSMTHFHVLTLLRHHDPMPMGRLAEILDASMSSTTGIIDRMDERGLVERVRVPDDRRIVLVRPTRAGDELVDEAELVKSEILASALGRLAPQQLDRLARAATDLEQAIVEELASDPDRYGPLTQLGHDNRHPHAGHGVGRAATNAAAASQPHRLAGA